MVWRRICLLIVADICIVAACAQEYAMMSGLMNVPTAEVAKSGTVRISGAWLNRDMLPDQFNYKGEKYNTVNYGVGIAAFDWLEMSFGFTVFKRIKATSPNEKDFFNQDRHINVKIRPLKEGRWWPAMAIGMDDIGGIELKEDHSGTGGWRPIGTTDDFRKNNYYQNIYIVGSKHLDFGQGGELSLHLSYRYFTTKDNKDRTGIAGGVAYRPNFCRDLRVMAEWDGQNVNAGVDWLAWKRLYLAAGLTNGKRPFGVISYHYVIPF